MKIRLSSRDIELICFIGRYKQIKSVDCKKIYKSKDYYRKRLKVLEKAGYVKRENTYYIKIDIEGRRLLQDFGYESYNLCRNKDYKDRIKDVAKIAMLGFEDNINFIPSWELKENNIYTDLGRKYIGELEILQNKYIVFLEDFDRINKRNKYFTISGKSIQVINPTEDNLKLIKTIKDIDIYDVVKEIYKGKEILLSNWNKADFMTEDKRYIIFMPFIDTGKLHKLNIAYGDNKEAKRNIDILTLKGNRSKINEMLVRSTNIIEIDRCLDKIRNESMLCIQ